MEWFMTARAILPVQKSKFQMQTTFPSMKSNSAYSRFTGDFLKYDVSALVYFPRANFKDFKDRAASQSEFRLFVHRSFELHLLCDKIWRHAIWLFFFNLPQLFVTTKSVARYVNACGTVRWFSPDNISCWIIRIRNFSTKLSL